MTRSNEIKILLVEDNPGDILLIREALGESIYQYSTLMVAECIADAKKMAHENFVLLLLDLSLPDSTGVDTITQMQNYFPNSTFIILTGLHDEEVALESLRKGAQNYLTKDDVSGKVLSRAIRFSLERHEITQQLKATEKRLVDAQAVAKVGSWETDLVTLEVIWSLETYRIFELDPSQFQPTHTTFLDYVHPEDKLLVDDAFKSSFGSTHYHSIIHRIVINSRNEKWVEEKWKVFHDDKGNPNKASGTCQDITKRVLAEQLIQSEKFLSDSIINSLPGIFYMSEREGRLKRWNHNLEVITEYSADEIKKMDRLDFIDEEEKELLRTAINNVFLVGSAEVNAHLYTKSKKKIPYYFNGHKIKLNKTEYMIGVGIDISERTLAEKELMNYTQEIKKLTAYLDRVREEERSRIAREIHDELGQQLTGLKMDATWVAKAVNADEKLHKKLIGMLGLIDETVKTVRRISTDLRPGILDDLGLMAALEWQCTEFEKKSEIKCVFQSDLDDLVIERDRATGIFRIFQESLTNILRHADATRIESTVKQSENEIAFIIQDNGKGFDLSEIKKKETLGLIGMRERAMILGGNIRIESELGKGTSVILEVPIT